ncbi:uncharacterized protein LOC125867192 [Solanum stenotomum]|uniref:uncharacterized protein LOC125867192 n=1 Tax=Solanum stenotomum TaxID=172797 RepID=UPI0020D18C70|nr:uncharacterized protein LOC125867192 [Solanum stenotomum]
MYEKEIVEVFVRVQDPEYYDRIMLLVGAKFAEIVKVGGTIDDGLRTEKIARVAASTGSLGLLKKKIEDVSFISYEVYQTPPHHYRNVTPNYANVQANYQTPPRMYQTPTPLYQNTPSNYQAPQPNYQTNSYPRYQIPRPNTLNYRQMPPPQQGNYDHSRPRFEKKPARNFTPLIESRTKLFKRLTAAGYIHPVGPKPIDTSSKFYRPDQRCVYHSNSVGHDTEDCINLKHKIQDLIDQNVCVTKTIVPIVPDELERVVASLSIREKKNFMILTPEKAVALVPREILTRPKFVIETAATQGMTRSGRCYTPKELAQGRQKKDQTKRLISEAEAKEFWRKMQPKDYSIVKHLEKTLAQISVWALLMSSQLHRQALMKALDDTYVPVGTNSDNLAAMINQVIRGHRISFCDEELPFEGRMHNKALHVTIKCRDKIINHVLVDDGSGLNICPLSTLKQLKFDLGKVQQN